jgi:hypothetical protein
VRQFILHANDYGHEKFMVTQIGCGHAGYRPMNIAPMFHLAPPNCYFDEAWQLWLPSGTRYWGSFK